jgi:phosphinothricin acetyltransferase
VIRYDDDIPGEHQMPAPTSIASPGAAGPTAKKSGWLRTNSLATNRCHPTPATLVKTVDNRPVHVRDATAGDLPAIRELFNALIPTTTIAWRDDLASADEIATWFAQQQAANFPVLVADLDGLVAGYTCWSTFRGGPRFPGYRHTVELTIHVRGDHHGRGVGRALMDALLDRARASDIHVLVAGIDAENGESIAFHRALGFVEVARMPETGRKFDRWLDLVLMQRAV